MSSFYDPLAWPDLLCAYQPKTRLKAFLHVLVAIFLAVLSWGVFDITFYWSIAHETWTGTTLRFIEYKTMTSFVLLAMLCCQAAAPFLYLWVVLHRKMCASSSQQAALLQKDIQVMLEANALLKKHPWAATAAWMLQQSPVLSCLPHT